MQRAQHLVRCVALTSTMSISPLEAQPPYCSSVGSIQIAGQIPTPWLACADFDAAVLPVAAMLGANAAGGVLSIGTADAGLVASGFQDQTAIFDTNVFLAIGINLQFTRCRRRKALTSTSHLL